jgi:hypothetical protein
MELEQCSNQDNEILCLYSINNMQWEPHHHHQNHAERRIQEVKTTTNAIMDHTATPAKNWSLCLRFVIYLFNHSATDSIGGHVPMRVAYGGPTDCSALLNFSWFQDVMYRVEGSYPSIGKEELGCRETR